MVIYWWRKIYQNLLLQCKNIIVCVLTPITLVWGALLRAIVWAWIAAARAGIPVLTTQPPHQLPADCLQTFQSKPRNHLISCQLINYRHSSPYHTTTSPAACWLFADITVLTTQPPHQLSADCLLTFQSSPRNHLTSCLLIVCRHSSPHHATTSPADSWPLLGALY